MTAFVVLAATLATSILSGIVGMAGGMILMALLTVLLPVTAAMMLHGVIQGVANGSRAWFLRGHVRTEVLAPYLVGGAAAVALFTLTTFVPDPGLVLLLVGLFPWVGRVVPSIERLDVTRRGPAVLCGTVVTAAQLLAGASGPLLDVFFLRSALTRHEIVATKAVTQTLGHLAKLGYYGAVVFRLGDGTADGSAPAWWFVAAPLLALAGTRIGTRILDRLDEARFRRASEVLVLGVGLACTLGGLIRLLS